MSTSLYDTIQSHLNDFESQLYTTCPAVVDSYNPNDCTVNVFPSIYRAESDGLLIKDQILTRVPLHFQATKQLGITFPIRKGDTVLLVFSHLDIENWSTDNTEYVAPKTLRKHNINDAFAIAGVFKYDKTPVQSGTEEDLNIRYNGSYVRIKANGDVDINTPSKVNVTAGVKVTVTAPDIEVIGSNDITLTAPEVTINSTTSILLEAPLIDIDASVELNFGGIGGAAIARVGDEVTVIGGSSAGVHLITSGSSLGSMN